MDRHDLHSYEQFRFATDAAPMLKTREAVEFQRALMPPPIYAGVFVHAAATARPRHAIGGDFYDYLDTGREFHFALGDACGKGTSAALQAALVQGMLAADVGRRSGAAPLVAHLNQTLCRRRLEERFVTLFYGVMSPDHRLTYCNAGHCRPMLVDHSSVRLLCVGGVPPGLFADAVYDEESLSINRGDTLVVFSDGFSEALQQGEEFGDARLLEIVRDNRDRSASAILDRLIDEVRDLHNGRQRDDMSVIVVRYLG